MNQEALISPDDILTKVRSDFRPALIQEVLKSNFTNPKMKISDEAINLIGKIAKVLVIEAAARSAKQAKLERKTTVNLDHMEVMLPQLMLDFP